MPAAPVNAKVSNRLKTLEIGVCEIIELIDNRPEDLLNINIHILNTVKASLLTALPSVKEAKRQMNYWEAKRGGRPRGFIPDRSKRGRYGG